MAFPAVADVTENSTNSAGTNHTINHPTVVAGQLWLLILDKGSTSASVNAHSLWTELLDEAQANGLYIAYRWTNGTEGASSTLVTTASTRSASHLYRITGAENPATQAPQIGTTASGSSATPDPPASATPGATKDFLFIAFYGAAGEEADDNTWSDTPPTNYTPSPPHQKSCGIAGTNLGGLIASAWRQLNTGAAENPGAFAKDVSAAWRAQTIMVHPASSQQFQKDLGTNALSFAGAAVKATTFGTGRLVGGLSFAGTPSRQAGKILDGALSFGGALARAVGKALVGALSFSGAVARQTSLAIAGALSFAGGIARATSKFFDGALSFGGTLTRAVGKALVGVVGFAGDAARTTARALDGALSFVGALTASKIVLKSVEGALSFAGAATRSTARALDGALSFTGAAAKTTARVLDGALSFAGTIVAQAQKALSGAVTFAGATVTATTFGKALAGALSFAGDVVKQAGKSLDGAVSFSGAVTRGVGKAVSGALSFGGSVAKGMFKSLIGALSFVGHYARTWMTAAGAEKSLGGKKKPSILE